MRGFPVPLATDAYHLLTTAIHSCSAKSPFKHREDVPLPPLPLTPLPSPVAGPCRALRTRYDLPQRSSQPPLYSANNLSRRNAVVPRTAWSLSRLRPTGPLRWGQAQIVVGEGREGRKGGARRDVGTLWEWLLGWWIAGKWDGKESVERYTQLW